MFCANNCNDSERNQPQAQPRRLSHGEAKSIAKERKKKGRKIKKKKGSRKGRKREERERGTLCTS